MDEELQRNLAALKQKAEPAPYFISYEVIEDRGEAVTGTNGAVSNISAATRRAVDCSVRVGSPEFDNYHVLDGNRPRVSASAQIPIEDKPEALKMAFWRETDRAWRAAADRYIRVKTSSGMKADAAKAPDFAPAKPVSRIEPLTPMPVPREEWTARARRLSQEFARFPGLLDSLVSFSLRHETRTLVNSEGTRIHHGRRFARVTITARAKAADGEDLLALDYYEAEDPSRLPKEAALLEAVRKLGSDLKKLMASHPADPYAGPAILSGRAAAVFFHEIFGHRVEGHRQSDTTEGQTWSRSVGSKVLPDFLSVIFDPTRRTSDGTDLNGWYLFDDEGVPAQKVTVVDKGVLRAFLMSRSPIEKFPESNGHGRKQAGLEAVARQSNLIVESSQAVSDKELRTRLIAEARRQNKPYGLYFDMVTGGFTTTRRDETQAFTVIPLIVYKIYVDGRPDELVRGVELIGTPLASFSKILATSEKSEVFNGYCGAESGSVPVAAVSPAILVSEIEIQRKANPGDRPPLLPSPIGGGTPGGTQ